VIKTLDENERKLGDETNPKIVLANIYTNYD
jgi:hypothetical protein